MLDDIHYRKPEDKGKNQSIPGGLWGVVNHEMVNKVKIGSKTGHKIKAQRVFNRLLKIRKRVKGSFDLSTRQKNKLLKTLNHEIRRGAKALKGQLYIIYK